jgi:hypothetical protein
MNASRLQVRASYLRPHDETGSVEELSRRTTPNITPNRPTAPRLPQR